VLWCPCGYVFGREIEGNPAQSTDAKPASKPSAAPNPDAWLHNPTEYPTPVGIGNPGPPGTIVAAAQQLIGLIQGQLRRGAAPADLIAALVRRGMSAEESAYMVDKAQQGLAAAPNEPETVTKAAPTVKTIVDPAKLRAAVAKQLGQGASREAVIAALVKRGLPEFEARVFVNQVSDGKLPSDPLARRSRPAEPRARVAAGSNAPRKRGTNPVIFMLIGAVLMIGGVGFTLFSYLTAAENGGSFVICWGPVLFGLLGFSGGLAAWLTGQKEV
jgi:hypothetical protein